MWFRKFVVGILDKNVSTIIIMNNIFMFIFIIRNLGTYIKIIIYDKYIKEYARTVVRFKILVVFYKHPIH